MVNLIALAVVAFALALVILGLFDYFRTRKPRSLLPASIGLVLLTVLFFAASRFAVQLFGALPIALDLNQFASDDLLALAAILVAAALALGVFLLARRRLWLALVLLVLGVVGASAGMVWASQATVVPDHPSFADIQLPDQFKINVFQANASDPSALAFDDAGNLYYAALVDGNIIRLRDTNGDGVADEQTIVASGFKNPRGLAWHDGMLYVSSRGQINTLRDTNGDGVADENKVIIDGLFSLDIQHSNNGIAFGPDGKLYMGIGGPRVGQLDLKDKTYYYQGQPRDDWMFGGIMVMDADGKNPQMYARGLRNPYDLAFAADGKLYAIDNGDETIPVPDGDELNLITKGADYGYPYFFGIPPPWSGTVPPLIPFTPHTAPTGVTVYNATEFPKAYRGDVYVAFYWHGATDGRYRQVIRASSDDKGNWMMSIFADGLDRPTALTVGPDGALYVADMRGGKADPNFPGVIYRITYDKEK